MQPPAHTQAATQTSAVAPLAMTGTTSPDQSFLAQLTAVIDKNLPNEQFGVSELAHEMAMSRSNLLRKVKKETNLSVTQLISKARLTRAMELLRTTGMNVSEVGHEVGFNSPSYFIKCFREYYGYPPGEAVKREAATPAGTPEPVALGKLPEGTTEMVAGPPRSGRAWLVAAAVLILIAASAAILWNRAAGSNMEAKSIAVLPFKNDSNDSTNLYLINGLMESTLNKLQEIEDLRVISRTTVEKYRNTSRSIPELAGELKVKYFVEGSGQKIGDRIVLNIQLIDAATDKHLWAKQYQRDTKDIFALQEEIARNITDEIEVLITPEEKQRIEKKPTDDLVAYDYYLKGREHFYHSGRPDLEAALPLFLKAVERDPEFSLAYANATMVCYYLDIFNFKKEHTAEVDDFAEKAILYDARSAESMVAKALSFAQKGQYELAIPYLEKALAYAPRSGLVLHFLTEFYNIHVPHPPKYLEYAIRKVKVDQAVDSGTASFNYFHLGNALLQNGFLNEALVYSDKSLQLDAKSFFGGFVNDYIHYAIDQDPAKARDKLMARWKKDTLRFDILQEAGKMAFITGDFATAANCYDRALATMKVFGLDIFKHEYLRMAMAYEKVGQKEKAATFANRFKAYADGNLTMYKELHLASYYAYAGDVNKAMQLFHHFADTQDNFLYWVLLMRTDPMLTNLQQHRDFPAVMKQIEDKFRKKHHEMKQRWGDEFKNL